MQLTETSRIPQQVVYYILGPDSKYYGELRFLFIDVSSIRDDFYYWMDWPSGQYGLARARSQSLRHPLTLVSQTNA